MTERRKISIANIAILLTIFGSLVGTIWVCAMFVAKFAITVEANSKSVCELQGLTAVHTKEIIVLQTNYANIEAYLVGISKKLDRHMERN